MARRNLVTTVVPSTAVDGATAGAIRELRDDIEELPSVSSAEELAGYGGVALVSAEALRHRPAGVTTYERFTRLVSTTTTDATTTVLYAFALAPRRVLKLTVETMGLAPATGDVYTADFIVTYRRTGTAAPTIVSTMTVPGVKTDAGAAGWTSGVDTLAAENLVRVICNGAASTRINWVARISSVEFG